MVRISSQSGSAAIHIRIATVRVLAIPVGRRTAHVCPAFTREASMATALVLGATGGIGGEMAAGLLARGWQVRALQRRPDGRPVPGAEMVVGDAMNAADVAGSGARGQRDRARGQSAGLPELGPARDADAGQHHRRRPRGWTPASSCRGRSTISARTRSRCCARTRRSNPRTRKGAIRAEMERRLAASGVRCLIVRAGDFFGPHARNNWFSPGDGPARTTSGQRSAP